MTCDEVRALVPELALGIATGEERARALQHIASCADCRRHLDELSRVADQLLLLAPAHEPPVGFESRVVDRITPEPRRQRSRRALTAALAAVLAAGVALAVTYVATGQEREFAAHYAKALEQADGTYFGGVALRDAEGRRLGNVFAYEGAPSWVLVIVTDSTGSGAYAVDLVTRGGNHMPLGSIEVTDGNGSFGTTLPVRLREVARIELLAGGRAALSAEFPSP